MPPRGTPPAPLQVEGSTIINAHNNKVVSIHGINWFGFNVGMGMVDGLWAGGSAAATDFALITYQLRLLGYNAGEAGPQSSSGVGVFHNRARTMGCNEDRQVGVGPGFFQHVARIMGCTAVKGLKLTCQRWEFRLSERQHAPYLSLTLLLSFH